MRGTTTRSTRAARRAPGFLEVIRRIEAGETGGVIVARIDRFARSAPDGGAMVRRILDAGAIFASAQERIDPTTDFGKAMLTSCSCWPSSSSTS
jgi:DNA invertase Pin-like site-specific DNA recombinase